MAAAYIFLQALIVIMTNTFSKELSDISQKTDEELVALALNMPDAYAFLVDRYEEKLLRYIMRISSSSKEDAEDILQDVFLSAYKNLNDFDQTLKFSSWIYRIAHNKVISHFRKVSARPKTMTYEGDSQLLNVLASDEDLALAMEKKYTAQQVREILAEMDERYREVLVLKFLEEKDYKEISDILEKPMGTVATLINRAKKQFKERSNTRNQ
ncbi:MAG TPA: sigma-70 family RNA polymerase sigma factor [Patescibacteria group bacterium]